MISINLLPWRERLEAKKRKELWISLLIATFLALVLAVVGAFAAHIALQHQEQRIAYLQQQDEVLTVKVKETENLEKQESLLLQRLTMIDQLQSSRGVIAQIFNALPSLLPDNLYLSSWQRNGNEITFIGKAQSNADIASFMQTLSDAKWFKNAVLREIKAPVDAKDTYSTFTLDLTMISPMQGADHGQ